MALFNSGLSESELSSSTIVTINTALDLITTTLSTIIVNSSSDSNSLLLPPPSSSSSFRNTEISSTVAPLLGSLASISDNHFNVNLNISAATITTTTVNNINNFNNYNLLNETKDFIHDYNDFFPNHDNYYNESGESNNRLEHAPQLSKSAIIRVIVLSAMAIVSFLGNIATMWNIYKTRMLRRATRHSWSAIYSLIFHLSIADLLVTGFCIIGEAAWSYTVQWLAGEFACKSVKLFQMFSLYLSTYVLVLIGIDRWIAVKYPMKSLNMAKRCYRLLGGAYVLSILLSLPQFFIFRVARGPFVEDFYQCVTHGFYTAEWQEQLYTTFTLFFTFIIPLCILVVTYLSTFRTISGSEKMFQGSKLAVYSSKQPQTNRQRLIHKAKMKSLRISVVIIAAFLVCWTPYNVMMIIFMFLNPDKRLGEDLQSGIFFFGMSNSLVNPLIYGAFHLCPIKRHRKYSQYSLTRDNSYQRSPSMTATTQVDINGRHTTSRRSNYYQRNSIRRDQFGLLNSTTSSVAGGPTGSTAAIPTNLRTTSVPAASTAIGANSSGLISTNSTKMTVGNDGTSGCKFIEQKSSSVKGLPSETSNQAALSRDGSMKQSLLAGTGGTGKMNGILKHQHHQYCHYPATTNGNNINNSNNNNINHQHQQGTRFQQSQQVQFGNELKQKQNLQEFSKFYDWNGFSDPRKYSKQQLEQFTNVSSV